MSDVNTGLEVLPTSDPLKTVKGVKAKKLVRLLAEGVPPTVAEKEAGVTRKGIARDTKLVQKLQELANNYTLDDIAANVIVRAKLTKVLVEGEDKDSVAAAKVLVAILNQDKPKEVHHHIILDTPEAQESLDAVASYVEGEWEDL